MIFFSFVEQRVIPVVWYITAFISKVKPSSGFAFIVYKTAYSELHAVLYLSSAVFFLSQV